MASRSDAGARAGRYWQAASATPHVDYYHLPYHLAPWRAMIGVELDRYRKHGQILAPLPGCTLLNEKNVYRKSKYQYDTIYIGPTAASEFLFSKSE